MFRGRLSNRTIVRVVGKDASQFLQGLCTNDLRTLQPGGSIFGCFLTTNGRVLFDAILYQSLKETNDGTTAIYLDVDKSVSKVAADHLTEYRLRRKVKIDDLTGQVAVVVTNETKAPDSAETMSEATSESFIDPRSPFLKAPLQRILMPEQWSPMPTGELVGYTSALLDAGIGEGPSVFIKEKSLPFEGNIDMLNGVSFQKGCYLGQELTHRTHVMLVSRKRCVPLVIGGDKDAPFDPSVSSSTWTGGERSTTPQTLFVDKQRVGTVMQFSHNKAIGILRLRYFDETTRSLKLTLENGTPVTASIPSWWKEETIQKIFKGKEAE